MRRLFNMKKVEESYIGKENGTGEVQKHIADQKKERRAERAKQQKRSGQNVFIFLTIH